jgi:uncharacterized protein DUF3822
VNATYNIQPPDIDTLESRLFIILSLRGISFTILNPGNTFTSLATYDFPANTNSDAVANYVNELYQSERILQQPFKRIYIIHAFAESILVPGEFMNTDARKDMLELVHGSDVDRVIRNDFMSKSYIYNVYGIPSAVLSALQSKYPSAIHTHRHSLLPEMIQNAGNLLYCIFENGQLTVMLIKEHQLQVIQNFLFQSPGDVLYYLMNICKQYRTDVTELTVYITGLVRSDSTLVDELRIHFSNIILEHLPEHFSYDAEIAKLPSHYFSHLFSIAACVSSAE